MPAFTTLMQREKRKDRNQFKTRGKNGKNCRPLLPHLLVKKAMTGKAGSWESVKTFWRKRFGRQLCCREKGQTQYPPSTTLMFLQKHLTLKKRPTFPSLLASRMLTSVSVNALFKLFGFFISTWQPFDLQAPAAPALGASVAVWADARSADVGPEEVAGCPPPGNPS